MKKKKPKTLMEVMERFPDMQSGGTTGKDVPQAPMPTFMGQQPEDPDPWKHRSDGMRCKTCMWWLRKGGTRIGRCRRRAPAMSGFPVMFEHDWCGEHRLDETKV